MPSQATLASQARTTTDGSYTPYLVETINLYKNTYNFVGYVPVHLKQVADPATYFANCVKYAVANQQNVPTIKAYTQYIKRYKGVSGCHYI